MYLLQEGPREFQGLDWRGTGKLHQKKKTNFNNYSKKTVNWKIRYSNKPNILEYVDFPIEFGSVPTSITPKGSAKPESDAILNACHLLQHVNKPKEVV